MKTEANQLAVVGGFNIIGGLVCWIFISYVLGIVLLTVGVVLLLAGLATSK